MYIHIGGEDVILKDEIIAIFNLNKEKMEINEEFIKFASNEGKIIEARSSDTDYKSCIITDDNVYLSTISANTLIKRANNLKKFA